MRSDDYSLALWLCNNAEVGKWQTVEVDNLNNFRRYLCGLCRDKFAGKKFITNKNELGVHVYLCERGVIGRK